MSEESARNIAQKLCLGLAYIHMLNLAHMDIKPDNIMIDDNMNPIIIDFGLCGLHHHRNGTRDYWSPEQLVWESPDPGMNPLKFDTWQLGLVMYLCLGGSKGDIAFCDTHRERAFKGKQFCYHVSTLSVNGKPQDFVKKLLTVDHFKRPLVSEMLSHPWLQLD